MSKEKAIVKFNNGRLALLCSQCSVIIKTGKDFTEDEIKFTKGELEHLEPAICETCKPKK